MNFNIIEKLTDEQVVQLYENYVDVDEADNLSQSCIYVYCHNGYYIKPSAYNWTYVTYNAGHYQVATNDAFCYGPCGKSACTWYTNHNYKGRCRHDYELDCCNK